VTWRIDTKLAVFETKKVHDTCIESLVSNLKANNLLMFGYNNIFS